MTNIKDKSPTLIRHLEEHGYAKSYIYAFKAIINDVSRLQSEGKWTNYEDYYITYHSKSEGKRNRKKSLVGLVQQFDERGILRGGPCAGSDYLQTNVSNSLSLEFRHVIENYLTIDRERGLSESTLRKSALNCMTFLKHLQALGISSLLMVEERHVLNFFFQDGRLKYGYSFKEHIKAVLTANVILDSNCEKVISYLPNIKERRRNIEYLTTEETRKIKDSLFDMGNGLSFRDRAAVILLTYTGLRACDVANLKLEDIDWRNDVIRITQQKTKEPLTLPMRPVVGNALYDYITLERPRCGSHNVFLTKVKPTRAMGSSTISTCSVNKILRAAGVRVESGRRGSHIFRHLLATTLLENGVPQPVISATLGHTDPASTEVYLSTDFRHLKDCALPIDSFPIRKDVIYE